MGLQDDRLELIRQIIKKSGKVTILVYKESDEVILNKWGSTDMIENAFSRLHKRLIDSGLHEEAESLTMIDLPSNEDTIQKILNAVDVGKALSSVGINLD